MCHNPDGKGSFDYLCGVEVSGSADLPAEFVGVRIPAQLYGAFRHRDRISTIRRTVNTIWNEWLPGSGRQLADAPEFEHYEDFDPRLGTGNIEIWLPPKP